VKIKDKDIELLLRELEKEMDELEEGIRRILSNLKRELRKNDWWGAMCSCEDLLESLGEMRMLEKFYDKLKFKVEE